MSAINCKFEKIFLKKDSEMILKEYNELNKLLSSKQEKENLNPDEYQQIFQFNKSIIKNIKCFMIKSEKFFYIKLYYDFNDDKKRKCILLIREPYLFSFKDDDYIAFEKISLHNFLSEEYDKKKFIIVLKNSNLTFKYYNNFMDYDFSQFEIKYDYKNRKITQDKFQIKNVYIKKNIYKAEDINYYFPYYINIEEEDFNNFEYYETENRKKLLEIIDKYFDIRQYIAICGPFGSGKTVTLLKLIMTDETVRYFYINLWTISTNKIEEIKEILKYECVKLFQKNILELLNKKELSSDEKNMKEILDNIDNFNNKEKIFELILDIISLLKNIKQYFIIVFDQYSSKYDSNNINIRKIISTIENSNIKLLICSSMDNYDVKNNLSKSFVFDKELNFLSYNYVGVLIRLKYDFIKNESLLFQKLMYELGNLYFYYYILKENTRQEKDLNAFMKKEKETIQKEIESFYGRENNFIDRYKMTKDIIDIIYFINERKIYFYEDLEDLILKLPLKFLEIKKQEIKIIDLKNYASETGNNELIKKIKTFKKEIIEKTYIISKAKTRFFKNENIIQKTNKRKTNYYELINDLKPTSKIYIYFLDYLFPYVQDILTNIIYNETMNFGKLFFSNLEGQSQGGFLEYFIIEYIKEKKIFFEYDINGFESIETIVENSYFIQNHSSRKPETKINYEEKENYIYNSEIKHTKIKLQKDVILISQKQFTGKYYDCAFLFPITKDENDNRFKIAVCQISKNKIVSQRYYKEEHELILRNVKENVENKFDVEITEGYFFYIFSSQELDKNSIEFCKEYDFEYILFSSDIMNFDFSIPFNLKHAFITNTFPIQNSFSILPSEKFETNDKNKLIFYEEIKAFQKEITTKEISKENENILNKCFGENEYTVLGYFKNKFNVTKYCIWYDKENKQIYYTNFSKEHILFKELIFDNNEPTDNFVLIGIKKEIFYTGFRSITDYFKPK